MRLLLVAAVVTLTCAACRPGAYEPSRPLIVGDGAEVRWPDGCVPAGLRVRSGEDLVAAPGQAPQALARLRLGDHFRRDERLAYLAPAGSRYRLPVEPRAGERLRLGLARVVDVPDGSALRAVARILEPGAAPVALLERELPPAGSTAWSIESVDLSRWAGRHVTLELEALGDRPAGECALDLAAWAAPRLERSQTRRSDRPNVIWISVDTLRADRLGAYGGPRQTSPELDRFAARSIRFEWAISQAPWTKPSHRSMLSGLYPHSRMGLESPFIGVPFHAAGFRTIAVTGAGQLDSSQGFDRGFEWYRIFDWIHDPEPLVGEIVAETRDDPFFVFLHTYETHEPYTHTSFAQGLPSGRFDGEFSKAVHERIKGSLTDEEKAYALALYDGDIAYTDGQLGRLFRELERSGLLESTIVIVTSDHGEQFWEHGSWGHGQTLHDHQIRVPLLLWLPPRLGFRAERVESEQVELIDLYPTLFELVGIELRHAVHGRSLGPILRGEGPLPARAAFAEGTNIKAFDKRALRTPRMKFVLWEVRRDRDSDEKLYELYDLRADPGERNDLFGKFPERAALLRAEVERRARGVSAPRDEEIPAGADAELRKQLEALGYVGN